MTVNPDEEQKPSVCPTNSPSCECVIEENMCPAMNWWPVQGGGPSPPLTHPPPDLLRTSSHEQVAAGGTAKRQVDQCQVVKALLSPVKTQDWTGLWRPPADYEHRAQVQGRFAVLYLELSENSDATHSSEQQRRCLDALKDTLSHGTLRRPALFWCGDLWISWLVPSDR